MIKYLKRRSNHKKWKKGRKPRLLPNPPRAKEEVEVAARQLAEQNKFSRARGAPEKLPSLVALHEKANSRR